MIRTIPAFFEAAVEACPSKVWLYYEDSTYTYGEAYDRVTTVAAALHERGAGRDTILLATTPNSPEYVFLWLAAMRLGAVLVPVNPASTTAELSGIAGQTQPQLVVTDEDLLGVVKQCIASVAAPPEIAVVETLLELSARGPLPPVQIRPEEPAVMIPTSGTTGRSKLVVHTHRAYVMAGEGFPFWLGLTSEERMMTSLPLFHINAPAYSVLGSMAARASLILLPRFSGSRFIESARRYGATQFNAIGAMLEILMRQPERPDDARNPLRLCYTGPSPTKERQLEIERRFGLEIVCGYALSESPYGLVWRRGTRPFGTLGSARQHPVLGQLNEARVTDQGQPVGPGEIGELELRNPAIMLGYYRMPEETDRVLTGGWLRTGDLVRDNGDGTYTFVARKKEVIRRRGENVSPTEVEAALEAHSDVTEAAVIGVSSDLSEEEIKAFVVLRSGAPSELRAVRAFTAERLARFKVPRYLEVVRELPHTSTGRIAKHRLPRERTAAEVDFEPATVPTDTLSDHPRQARRGRA